jgi:hypothetical protein
MARPLPMNRLFLWAELPWEEIAVLREWRFLPTVGEAGIRHSSDPTKASTASADGTREFRSPDPGPPIWNSGGYMRGNIEITTIVAS